MEHPSSCWESLSSPVPSPGSPAALSHPGDPDQPCPILGIPEQPCPIPGIPTSPVPSQGPRAALSHPGSPLAVLEMLAVPEARPGAPRQALSKLLCCLANCSMVSSRRIRCSRSCCSRRCHFRLWLSAKSRKSRQACGRKGQGQLSWEVSRHTVTPGLLPQYPLLLLSQKSGFTNSQSFAHSPQPQLSSGIQS